VIGSILLSSSGFFFLQYLIHVSILGTAGQLLDVGQNIWRWWKLRSAITEVEVENALKRWEYDFGYWYSARLTILAIVFIYSVFVPLVVPLGILFFFLSYLVDRRNFEHKIYTATWEDNGTFSRAVAQFSLIFAGIFLLFLASLMFVQETVELSLLGVIASFFMLVMFYSIFVPATILPMPSLKNLSSRLSKDDVMLSVKNQYRDQYLQPVIRRMNQRGASPVTML